MTAVPKLANKHIVRITEGGNVKTFAISKDEFLLGRDERADIRIPNSDVSARHLFVKIIDGLMISLRDPGSTNGTFVSGVKLVAGREFILDSLDDEILLGKVAKISITPATLQNAPKKSSRLAVVSPARTPAPPAESTRVGRIEQTEIDLLTHGLELDPLPDGLEELEDPGALENQEYQQTQQEPRHEGVEKHSATPEYAELEDADLAAAMAEEAEKASLAAQAAAQAAQAAHEKAKTAAAAREKAKAEKTRLEREQRELNETREKALLESTLAAAQAEQRAHEEAERTQTLAHAQETALRQEVELAAHLAREQAQKTAEAETAAHLEIAVFKKKAIAEIEAIQAEAVEFSENLKLEGRKDAEGALETARAEIALFQAESLREVEALKANSKAECDRLLEDGRRDAEYLRKQSQNSLEDLRQETEKLKTAEEKLRAVIEALNTENHRLRDDSDRLRAEQREENSRLVLVRQETESLQKLSHVQQAQADAAYQALEARRTALSQECEQTRQKTLESTQQLSLLSQDAGKLELQIQDSQTRLEVLRQELTSETKTYRDASEKSEEIKQMLRADQELLQSAQAANRREREVSEAEERRRKALYEALDAEFRVKRLSIDAQLAELDNQRADAERELESLQRLQTEVGEATERQKQEAEQSSAKRKSETEQFLAKQRAEAEQQIARLRAETEHQLTQQRTETEQRLTQQRTENERLLAHQKSEADRHLATTAETVRELEKEAQKAREKSDRFNQESERVSQSIQEQQKSLTLFTQKTEEAKSETIVAQQKMQQAQQTAIEARAHAEAERARMREETELEARNARELAQTEIHLLRQAAQTEIQQEITRRKETLQLEFAEKGKQMERELADAKLRELKTIQGMQDDEKRALRLRMSSTLEELVHKTLELARQKPLEQHSSELEQTFKSILEGKTAGTLSVEADERSKKFFKKMAIRASVPIGILLFFVLFPGVPGAIRDRFSRTVASEKNDSGVFLEQIKQRGLKFQPEMDRSYRGTYSDNILYLEEYVEMKLSDQEQKDWTLVLNDFIVGRLGLSDRIIPDFISAETVLVQDLMRIREGILPQFKEQGFARLAETEKQSAEKLIQLLQSPESYQKFRVFEKGYYESYLKRVHAGK